MNTDAHELTDLMCWDPDLKYPRHITLRSTDLKTSPCHLDTATNYPDSSDLGHRAHKTIQNPPTVVTDFEQASK